MKSPRVDLKPDPGLTCKPGIQTRCGGVAGHNKILFNYKVPTRHAPSLVANSKDLVYMDDGVNCTEYIASRALPLGNDRLYVLRYHV